jgi:hypothetical protein
LTEILSRNTRKTEYTYELVYREEKPWLCPIYLVVLSIEARDRVLENTEDHSALMKEVLQSEIDISQIGLQISDVRL